MVVIIIVFYQESSSLQSHPMPPPTHPSPLDDDERKDAHAQVTVPLTYRNPTVYTVGSRRGGTSGRTARNEIAKRAGRMQNLPEKFDNSSQYQRLMDCRSLVIQVKKPEGGRYIKVRV